MKRRGSFDSFALAVCWGAAVIALGCSRSDGDGPGDAGASGASAGAAGTTAGSGGAGGTAAGAMSAGGVGGAGTSGGAGATGGAAGTNAGSSGTTGGGGSAGEPASGACEVGGVSYESGATGIPAEDGCNTCSCSDGTLECTLIACPAEDPATCVVVRRYDQCCAPWAGVRHKEHASNPCLVEQGTRMPAAGMVPAGCEAPNCLNVLCAEPPPEPPSRVATPTGVGGACVFSDECHAEASCVLASDMRQCCACPVSVPEGLVNSQPCFARVGQPAQGCTEVCNSDIACGQCPEPTEPVCIVRDSWSLCQ